MALNSASHNVPGEQTGPVTGQPPAVSDQSKSQLLNAAEIDATAQHAPGRDGGDRGAVKKEKTERELAKERVKEEKARKFAEKQAKKAAAANNAGKAKKEKKVELKEELPPYVDPTPEGEKKILRPLDDPYFKAYNPKAVESAWYSWWERMGFFEPEFKKDTGEVKDPGYFAIPIPPPNVTGALHCGHALATALQDTMIRWNRMKGLTTLWLPGCDHAGISTQSVVETILWRREQKTRYDMGREKFVARIWDWKTEYHQRINNVLRRMGASVDWGREAFTMDEKLSRAVTETFVRLHEEGYIYRANRLVNWCTRLNTALSNLEVDSQELTGRTLLEVPGYDKKIEFGVLTYFKYPVDGLENAFIEIATTRVETMLGDTAVAVHPEDERYKHLIGKKIKHPFVDRLLPIVADEYVEREFGTGAVKITPGHDPNDFEIGKRHDLEFINILNDDGTLNHNAGPFAGQRRFDVRYSVVKQLEDLGLFVKKEDNPMKIPRCSKSKDIIEPIIKPQWWMKMKDLAEPAVQAVKDGRITIRPDTALQDYYRWLSNINDWCLSRQLWWGHQCPAYFVEIEGEPGDAADDQLWVTGRTEEEARTKAEKKFPGKKFNLIRDPDVLDTWFSSGLWPFSTLGWPDETPDLRRLYPTSCLETGWDILFFWVARMIIMGLKLTGDVPFREVYCHSLIRDSEGRKMSKSLGNVIDPIDVMEGIQLQTLHEKLKHGNLDPKEITTAAKYQKTAFPQGIPECGADALRFSLVQYTTGGGDIAMDIKVIHAFRRFCNKIFQATKYVLGKIGDDFVPRPEIRKSGSESLADRWILHKFTVATKEINDALTSRAFSKATQLAYSYWYDHLCDVYIENSKAIIQDGTEEERQSALDTLYTALEGGLLLIHPFMPFLTEELWQRLPRRPGDETPSIVVASYPQHRPELEDAVSETEYELVLGCSKGVRSLMSDYPAVKEGKVTIQTYSDSAFKTATSDLLSIKALLGKFKASVEVIPGSHAPPTGCAVFVVSSEASVFLGVRGLVDIEAEITRARNKLTKSTDQAAKLRKLIGSPGYKEKASDAAQEQDAKRLQEIEAEEKNFTESIEQFMRLKLE